MKFVDWLEAEAKRLNETADQTEAGKEWAGDTLTPSRDERGEAAAAMRESAKKLFQIAERHKGQ